MRQINKQLIYSYILIDDLLHLSASPICYFPQKLLIFFSWENRLVINLMVNYTLLSTMSVASSSKQIIKWQSLMCQFCGFRNVMNKSYQIILLVWYYGEVVIRSFPQRINWKATIGLDQTFFQLHNSCETFYKSISNIIGNSNAIQSTIWHFTAQ